MKKEEIHLWDWQRILFGQAPPQFLLEVLIRSLVIYVAAILVLRWAGKRMNGQLTIIELAVIVMMGAILAVPMQIPDRGLAQGFLVLLCVLLLLRGINYLAYKSSSFEKLLQGQVSLLVKDGIINLPELNKTRITHQQLYEILREKKIFQLAKVKRLYLEACGIFTVYPEEERKPGLPLFPHSDPRILEAMQPSTDSLEACCNCGKVIPHPNKSQACPNCGSREFVHAIL